MKTRGYLELSIARVTSQKFRGPAQEQITRTSPSLLSARLILSNVVHVSCDATDPFGLREQLFEFFGG